MNVLRELERYRDTAVSLAAHANLRGDEKLYEKYIEEADFWIGLIARGGDEKMRVER